MRTYADDYGRAFGTGFCSETDECEFYEPEQVCLWRCPHCRNLVLEVRGKISYPTGSGILAADCMPKDAREVFEEAQQIINLSPRASCALLRVCVERMVNASGAKGNNLAQKIESLRLPSKLEKIADACRLIGNNAVHSNTIDFSASNVEAQAIAFTLSKFANRIAEEIFGMPEEADAMLAKIEAARAKSQ